MRAERASKFIPFWPFGGRWYRRLGLTEEELDVHLREFYERAVPRLRRARGQAALGREHAVARVARGRAGAAVPGRGVRRAWCATRRGTSFERAPARADFGEAADAYAQTTTELVRQAARARGPLRARALRGPRPGPRADRAGAVRLARRAVGRRRRASTPRASTAERVSRWTRSVGEPRRERLEQRLGPLAAFLGYTLDDPHAPASLGAEGRLLRGAEARRALAEFPRPRRPHAAGRAADRAALQPARGRAARRRPPPVATAPPLPPRPTRRAPRGAAGRAPAAAVRAPRARRGPAPAPLRTAGRRRARRRGRRRARRRSAANSR